MHIHDAVAAGSFDWQRYVNTLEPQWDNFTAPGMGEVDLRQIVRELAAVGYDGYLSIECIGSGWEIVDYVTWHYNRMIKRHVQEECG